MKRVPRAVRQQVVDDLGMDLDAGKARRPADDVELVIVDLAGDGLRAVFDEQPDDREVAALGGEMQRERVVAFVADVRIGAALRAASGRRPRACAAEVQRRPQSGMPLERAALVDDVGVMRSRIACSTARRRRARRRAAAPAAPGRAVSPRAERSAPLLSARSSRRSRIRAPARTARRAGLAPPGACGHARASRSRASAIVRAQRLQPALRFLAEMFDGRTGSERTRHATPSFRYARRRARDKPDVR